MTTGTNNELDAADAHDSADYRIVIARIQPGSSPIIGDCRIHGDSTPLWTKLDGFNAIRAILARSLAGVGECNDEASQSAAGNERKH